MDDIAFVSPNAETTQHALSRVSRLGAFLGIRVRNSKAKICKWTPSPTDETTFRGGVPHKVHPPPPQLSYLGHLLSHPFRANKARSD